MNRLVPLLLACGLCCVPPDRAGAAAGPPIAVSVESASGKVVSYFRIAGRQGRSVRAGRLVLRNLTARPIRVLLDPVDAQTASTLGSAYAVRGLRIHGATRWTKLPSRRLTLAPRARAVVPVSVQIPAGAGAGDHLSGISVQAIARPSEEKLRSNVAVASVHRYAVGVQVAIPGPRRPRIGITGARVERQPAGLVFEVEARNNGNVILQGVRGRIRVLRAGHKVVEQEVLPGTFVSGTRIAYPVAARAETPREGTQYRVQATLRYRGGSARFDEIVRFGARQAQAQADFGGPQLERQRRAAADRGGAPWGLIGGGAGALGLAGLLTAAQRRRRRPRGEAAALATVERALKSAEPVSVIAIQLPSLEARARRLLVDRLRPRLRNADVLVDTGESGLVIVSPDAGPQVAAALADDLQRVLARGAVPAGLALGSATAEHPISAAGLVAAARREALPV